MLRYLALRLTAALAPRVPARPGYRAAALVADILYATAGGTRRLVASNLRAVVGRDAPARRINRLTRHAFRNLVWNYFELFRLAGAGLDEIRGQVTVEGLEYLREAAASSRTGVIIFFGHVGNLEALSQASLLVPEHRFVVVVENLADPRFAALFQRLRRSQGLELVRTDEPYRLLRRLRQGWHVIIAGDFDTTGTGTTVDFFGRPVRVPSGAQRLALRTGAPVLVVAGWREDMDQPWRCRARISPAIRLVGSPTVADDVRAAVQCVVKMLEEQVAARPEQWLAFRHVWTAGR